ncbi:alpha/beta hydrolase [Terrihabitans sp. B22-R8]|uniref:alpha/beta hydrolase n=1 Tax=Terrihabitans sp. B22-R8 TaxID=3425128 RepID=UPI00403CFA8F
MHDFRTLRGGGPGHLAMALLGAALLLVAAPATAREACPAEASVTVPMPDPVSGRKYEIYVSLPAGYAESTRTYPLLVMADGGWSSPKLGCEPRRLAEAGEIDVEPIVVGLSYAEGETREDSRRRDYTPVSLKARSPIYGEAEAYQTYIRDVVLKHIAAHYRIDPARRIYWGHSYGGLLGARILLTEPELFQTYLLGSPSFWFGDKAIYGFEEAYATRAKALDARVFLYVGGKEIARYEKGRRGKTRDMIAGMNEFEARLLSRGYSGLRVTSTIISDRDHRSSIGPGFSWSVSQALKRP